MNSKSHLNCSAKIHIYFYIAKSHEIFFHEYKVKYFNMTVLVDSNSKLVVALTLEASRAAKIRKKHENHKLHEIFFQKKFSLYREFFSHVIWKSRKNPVSLQCGNSRGVWTRASATRT